jgi:hypothetical protein
MRKVQKGTGVTREYTHRHSVPRCRGTSLIRTPPPRRTLQEPYAQEPMVILWGWMFLMSEVPL